MARGSLNVKVNHDYLETVRLKNKLTKRDFWESLGRSDSMEWSITQTGKMPPHLATLICKMYGADYDRLVIKEQPPEPAKAEKPSVDESLLRMAAALVRIESKQDETADALLILKNQLDEVTKILHQLL